VNRCGNGGGFDYSGDTSVFDPFGLELYHVAGQVAVHTTEISKNRVTEIRTQIPYLGDRDTFKVIV
jgi:predicted amidohydrolase